jgi:hypothetical protein
MQKRKRIRPVEQELPTEPLPLYRIDRKYKGEWLVVEITATDEFHTPLEGKVIAVGKEQVDEAIDRITASGDLSTRYCLFRGGLGLRAPTPSSNDISA